jgi:hypothetical protein
LDGEVKAGEPLDVVVEQGTDADIVRKRDGRRGVVC